MDVKPNSPCVWLVLTALMCGLIAGALEAFENCSRRLACEKKVATMKLSSGDFRQIVNEHRKARGLCPLAYDKRLDDEAQYTAEYDAERGALIHIPCGRGTRGEIIAFNSSGFRYAVGQWRDSPGHRALLENPNFQYAGCACVKRDGRYYCCVRFR